MYVSVFKKRFLRSRSFGDSVILNSTKDMELMSDSNTIRHLNTDWKHYRTSIDAIERATGYDIMSNVPPEIQDILEAKVDKL